MAEYKRLSTWNMIPRLEENLARHAISLFQIITNADKGKLHLLKESIAGEHRESTRKCKRRTEVFLKIFYSITDI